MKRHIARQIYAYTVCVISLIVGVVYIATGIYGIVRIAAPEFTVSQREWKTIATFQSFKTDWERSEKSSVLTDEELRVRWQDRRDVTLMGEKREGAQNLVNMLIALVIIAPVFLLHWRLARTQREE
jgi:hypothetical protein